MGDFLRENWIWIVAPIILVIAAVAVVLLMSGGDSTAPFVYQL